MVTRGWLVLMAVLLVASFTAFGDAIAQPAYSIERVSVGKDDRSRFNYEFRRSIFRVSFDGDRVLFQSEAPLVLGDRNKKLDGFMRIRSLRTTKRVTLRADGSDFNEPGLTTRVIGMSSNAQFVAFELYENTAVQQKWELFLRDTETGQTELLTASSIGGWFREAAISDDGKIVAFVSSASDLTPGDQNGNRAGEDVFVLDRSTARLNRLRVPGSPRWWVTSQPEITPDGRYVVFKGGLNLYRVDLRTREYDPVALVQNPQRSPVDRLSTPVISADGRFVAYYRIKRERPSGPVEEGVPSGPQVLLQDMMTGDEPQLVTMATDGGSVNGLISSLSMSADARFIVFSSNATNLGPDASSAGVRPTSIYLFDTADDSISLVSRDGQGEPFDIVGSRAYLSGDGSTIVFDSYRPDLVDGDTNDVQDLFALSLAGERCAGRVATIVGAGEIMGTDGTDVIVASVGTDSIYAGAGDDIICALGGGDSIDAGTGDDLIYAGSGNDIIYAGDGHDIVFAGKDDDIVNAGEGNDRAFGGPGTDIVRGNDGDDKLGGGRGYDTLVGGPGNDAIAGGADIDTCKGSAGRDRYFLCEERQP